ncbi:MAG: hypothetical protein VXV96_08115 [Bdellovibrionota bacterium]|nr:hypothetical protein [Bdellovibrionota bacterium]
MKLFAVLLSLLSLNSFADQSEKITKLIKENPRVLIHVHARWCPSC